MENVVPAALQRLRAADIIRMAGLTTASLGKEYCRVGAVLNTKRQGMRITGIVTTQHVASSSIGGADAKPLTLAEPGHCSVEVEVQNSTLWVSRCTCSPVPSSLLCSHAAALLYQWLEQPATFNVSAELPLPPSMPIPPSAPAEPLRKELSQDAVARKLTRSANTPEPGRLQHSPIPVGSLSDILIQLGLSDLRSIAREYEIAINGMNKQQLAEAILQILKEPEAVRRVATTLEKQQRQLLAALTLAGGSLTDDDLRSLYERFSLGPLPQLQSTLIALQGKALLFRTSVNSASPQSIGLGGTLLDIGWYVPQEVQTALRVSMPVTAFNIEQGEGKNPPPHIQMAEAYRLLADLLLVARALDGYHLGQNNEWFERSMPARPPEITPFMRSSSSLSNDGAVTVPPPGDMLPPSLLEVLQKVAARSPASLRFAVLLLRLADILYKDDNGSPYLRVMSKAAHLLLGPARTEVIRELFELWLTQSSYEELYDLSEEGLRVRCRSTSLNLPMLRSGELEAENSEARQTIIVLLSQAPLDQWISFAAFARFVYRLNPLFLQKRQRLYSTPHWWLEQEEGRPLRPLQLNDWMRAEMHYLARLLAGPLHWWGTCDIALSQDGRLQAFRLTPMAGWLFNGLRTDAEEVKHNYQSLSNSLEVISAEDVLIASSSQAWSAIELLETFTEAAGARRERLCYRVTPDALGNAISRGHSPAPLLDLLRSVEENGARTDSDLLQIVARLERWIASYGRVRIYTGVTMLEMADQVVMRELAATTSINEQIVWSIHPTLHILKKSGAERLLDDFKRRGQSPLLHDEDLYGPE